MNFYIVFTKNRKRFDKYVKVNRIKSKVILSIEEMKLEYGISGDEFQEYFNLLIYTKINHTINKKKDIYYLPNFNNENIKIDEILKIKKILGADVKFNILMFYDEFKNDNNINDVIFSNMDIFDASQILKSY